MLMLVCDDSIRHVGIQVIRQDEMRILPKSHQLHGLFALCVVKQHRIGDQIRRVLIGGVDGHFHENENAVVGGNYHIMEFFSGNAIHIDAIIGLVTASEINVQFYRIRTRIGDGEAAGDGGDGREDGVKHNRIRRKDKFCIFIIGPPMAAGEGERAEYQRDK